MISVSTKTVLTTRDLLILQAMLECRRDGGDPILPQLRQKIDAADLVFAHDLPATIATVNSRVSYTLDAGPAQTRVLAAEGVTHPDGMHLSIATPCGLALLGMAEGDAVDITTRQGETRRLCLERVLYQRR